MTDIKLQAAISPDADLVFARWRDRAARVSVVLVFSALAVDNLAVIWRQMPLDSTRKILMALAAISSAMFLGLIASTTLTRLVPIGKAKGIEPRISALLGTFLTTALAMLPKAELGPVLSGLSSCLIMTGALLSFAVLRWLGKSFSISAEARCLVTAGPYSIVRHPLYLCEGLIIVGALLQVISPTAVLLVGLIAFFQYRRMINEEAILNAAFPAYRAYAAHTPRVIPSRLFRSL